MASRIGGETVRKAPVQTTDGAQLVGVLMGGPPLYYDASRDSIRAAADTGGGETHAYRYDLDADESVADAIATIERRRGWRVLSAYGRETLTSE